MATFSNVKERDEINPTNVFYLTLYSTTHYHSKVSSLRYY